MNVKTTLKCCTITFIFVFGVFIVSEKKNSKLLRRWRLQYKNVVDFHIVFFPHPAEETQEAFVVRCWWTFGSACKKPLGSLGELTQQQQLLSYSFFYNALSPTQSLIVFVQGKNRFRIVWEFAAKDRFISTPDPLFQQGQTSFNQFKYATIHTVEFAEKEWIFFLGENCWEKPICRTKKKEGYSMERKETSLFCLPLFLTSIQDNFFLFFLLRTWPKFVDSNFHA